MFDTRRGSGFIAAFLATLLFFATIEEEKNLEESDLEKKTIEALQQEVDGYISQFKEGYFSPLALMARLTEELGELAREVNHYYGEKKKKTTEAERTVEEELGDLLFVVICMANSLHIDLGAALEKDLDKFRTRDKGRWTKKTDEGAK